eukprot:1993031-Amphidinium_carterae.1
MHVCWDCIYKSATKRFRRHDGDLCLSSLLPLCCLFYVGRKSMLATGAEAVSYTHLRAHETEADL